MAEKGFFFNAFPDSNFETGYDRNYSADDISNWLQVAFTTGVVKTNSQNNEPQGLKVVATSGMTINVNAGYACILGKPYLNNALVSFTVPTAPTSGTRYDYIVLRMDNTQVQGARRTYLRYVEGGSSVPTVSNLTRTDEIYDLMLAYIQVGANVTTIQQGQIKDQRGDASLCPWFTAVKGYEDYYDAIVQQFESNITLASSSNVVTTTLASSLYNDRFSIIEVYCNGLKEENTAYSVSTSGGYIVITFTAQKTAGAKISVVLDNFLDGEGLETALAQYTSLVQDVADLKAVNNYTYVCNGSTDNVEISNLVNAFINGGSDYGALNLKIIGTFGYTAYANGSGTSANPYRLFDFASGNRKVFLDFTNCSQITLNETRTSKYVWAFVGDFNVKGLNIVASGTGSGTSIRIFSGNVVAEDCRFWINAYSSSWIAKDGTFTNCRGSVANASGNGYCFLNSGFLRINGGEYLAYTGGSSAKSAVVGQSASNAVAILYGVSAPTSARTGYYQTNSIYQTGDNYVNCTDLVSQLTLTVVSGKSNVRGTIPYSL